MRVTQISEMTSYELQDLCRYVAEYVQYELHELKKQRKDIDEEMIENAMQAWLGGARGEMK